MPDFAADHSLRYGIKKTPRLLNYKRFFLFLHILLLSAQAWWWQVSRSNTARRRFMDLNWNEDQRKKVLPMAGNIGATKSDIGEQGLPT